MAQKEINNYMNACPIQECGQRGRGQGLLQQECQRYVFQPFLNFHFFYQQRDKSMALSHSKNISIIL